MFKRNRILVHAAVAATVGLPMLCTSTVYAKTISPSASWSQVTQNTQKAPNLQVEMKETVTVSGGGTHDVISINISAAQQQKGKNLNAIVKVSEADAATKQKQAMQLFQVNNNIYQSVGGKWQLVEHSKAPLVGQYVSQLYTNIKMQNTRSGHHFTMGADAKELAALVQELLGANPGQANMTKILKSAKTTIVANSAKIAGAERLSNMTVDIDVPTTEQAVQGTTSNSDQTVTGSVYGPGSGSGASTPLDIRVHETVAYTYKNTAVAIPRGIPKQK